MPVNTIRQLHECTFRNITRHKQDEETKKIIESESIEFNGVLEIKTLNSENVIQTRNVEPINLEYENIKNTSIVLSSGKEITIKEIKEALEAFLISKSRM